MYDNLEIKDVGGYKRVSAACASFFLYATAWLQAVEA